MRRTRSDRRRAPGMLPRASLLRKVANARPALFQKKHTRSLGCQAPGSTMVNTNTGNQGNVGGNNQKFVPAFEQAITQFVILNKAQQGEITKENLQSTFRGSLQPLGQHLDMSL